MLFILCDNWKTLFSNAMLLRSLKEVFEKGSHFKLYPQRQYNANTKAQK